MPNPQSALETSVLIAGAGPVGMIMALDLASRGVDVIVVEKRTQDAKPQERCNHIAARTLEVFRRLGVADEIRGAGMPATMSAISHASGGESGTTWRQHAPQPFLHDTWRPSRASRSTATSVSLPLMPRKP